MTGNSESDRYRELCGQVWVHWYPRPVNRLIRLLNPRLARVLDEIHGEMSSELAELFVNLRRDAHDHGRIHGPSEAPE